MSRDKGLLVFIWLFCALLVAKLVPIHKIRNAIVTFFYKQSITWLFGLVVAESGLIKYPVREFPKAYKGSFSFEYFFYPSLCALFNIYYPENKSKLIKFLYINIHTAIVTIIEVILEKYTTLIKYVKWKWYYSYITLFVTYFSSRMFYKWFFKEDFASQHDKK
ncbi:CBO0543 family protein [Calidifontibacillus erzurumensis]|uniref:Uncharacterized protein n=1 Tax=Calidifontibacillus erzurumensis TaxID=2741433 RepID=A0A8J8GII2_9BACI|nr:CBO0543 family protein [Calidifontibacillus erzurumensis]NSL52366.1 hypothetical protein [Calidifontibacillus erzurumensis]